MQPNDITFFQRFQDDILAGRKTITIRNADESHFKTGDVLRVGRYEDDFIVFTNIHLFILANRCSLESFSVTLGEH